MHTALQRTGLTPVLHVGRLTNTENSRHLHSGARCCGLATRQEQTTIYNRPPWEFIDRGAKGGFAIADREREEVSYRAKGRRSLLKKDSLCMHTVEPSTTMQRMMQPCNA